MIMTQEEKELLLKDLCARLPYGVKVNVDTQGDFALIGLTKESIFTACEIEGWHYNFPIEIIKPYLFPLSSMTEEQKEEYCGLQQKIIYNSKGLVNTDIINYINWCYKNHIDVNGLIPIGLAHDATGLNIY